MSATEIAFQCPVYCHSLESVPEYLINFDNVGIW